ncbi:hypothetical protein C5B99_12335 [Pseudoclavibacter sp. Z016]|nr:hypothetical protein C5B99_12335 [Pseudoclavibacter sp. Z016]
MTVHLAVQADATRSIPCIVRAAAPPVESSYTSYGKLAIRLDDRDHLVHVDTREGLALYAALKRHGPAPAFLDPLGNDKVQLTVHRRARSRLA